MREVDGKTKVYGLIGHPVEHTVSPLIHNTLAEHYNYNMVYVGLDTGPDKLKEAIEGAYAFGFPGMNVTVPFKSQVIPYLKELDFLAAKIGAVNTLVSVPGGYKGYNTDMPGLYRAMQSDGVPVKGEEFIILGAGGVARAVTFMLLEYGAEKIYIMNRTPEKAKMIADEMNEVYGKKQVFYGNLTYYREIDPKKYTVIQATNVGMYPNMNQTLIEEEDFYRMVKVGYDLIYNPLETLFMKKVRATGGTAFHGLKMLLYQGIIAYELWNHVEVDEKVGDLIFDRMKEALYG